MISRRAKILSLAFFAIDYATEIGKMCSYFDSSYLLAVWSGELSVISVVIATWLLISKIVSHICLASYDSSCNDESVLGTCPCVCCCCPCIVCTMGTLIALDDVENHSLYTGYDVILLGCPVVGVCSAMFVNGEIFDDLLIQHMWASEGIQALFFQDILDCFLDGLVISFDKEGYTRFFVLSLMWSILQIIRTCLIYIVFWRKYPDKRKAVSSVSLSVVDTTSIGNPSGDGTENTGKTRPSGEARCSTSSSSKTAKFSEWEPTRFTSAIMSKMPSLVSQHSMVRHLSSNGSDSKDSKPGQTPVEQFTTRVVPL